MGIFSFLSGKSGAEGATIEQAQDGARQVGAASSAQADAAARTEGTPGAESTGPAGPASSGVSSRADTETPFAPPAAWDMDTAALTAPAPSTSGSQPQVGPPDPVKTAALQAPIIEVIKTVYDPEIPVDIYELGLIYEIVVDADNKALVRMTLTSPACPSAQQLPSEVRYKVKAVEGITDAAVEVVWEPPWDKDRMSEAAKLSLGFF